MFRLPQGTIAAPASNQPRTGDCARPRRRLTLELLEDRTQANALRGLPAATPPAAFGAGPPPAHGALVSDIALLSLPLVDSTALESGHGSDELASVGSKFSALVSISSRPDLPATSPGNMFGQDFASIDAESHHNLEGRQVAQGPSPGSSTPAEPRASGTELSTAAVSGTQTLPAGWLSNATNNSATDLGTSMLTYLAAWNLSLPHFSAPQPPGN